MKKIFLMGFATAALLSSCSQDETINMATDATGAIGFSQAFVDNATRSVADPSTTLTALQGEHGGFDVYGFTTEGQIFDGVKVSYSSEWTYTPLQYWIEGNTYAFGAIAPSGTTVSGESLKGSSVSDYKVGMTVSFTNTDGKTDLLHAAPNAVEANKAFMASPQQVSLTFKHQLSKVKFSFVNSIGEAYNIKVSDVKITDAKKTGTLTIGEGDNAWSNQGGDPLELDFGNVVTGTESGTAETAAAIAYNAEGETYNELLMIPTSLTESYTVTFKVELLSGSVLMGTYNHEATISDVELKLGYCYDFKATLTSENTVIDPEDPDKPVEMQPIEFKVNEVDSWTNSDEEKDLPVGTTPEP